MLTNAELTQARADVAETLTQTAYVLRETPGTGFYGPHNPTWGTVGTVIARLDNINRSSGEALIADAEVGVSYYRLSAVYNADIRDGDRVKVDSITFEVLQIQTQQALNIVTRGVLALKDEGN